MHDGAYWEIVVENTGQVDVDKAQHAHTHLYSDKQVDVMKSLKMETA